MIRRLVDAHHTRNQDQPSDDQIRFWLRESRTPEVLIAVAATYPMLRDEVITERQLLVETLSASRSALRHELLQEETLEKAADEAYWRPLRQELEALRFNKRKKG